MEQLGFYTKYKHDMILRDFLAKDRTELANERTLLAYVRTFAGFFAGGAGIVKLFNDPLLTATGILFMLVSPLFLGIGLRHYAKMRKKLMALNWKAEPDTCVEGISRD